MIYSSFLIFLICISSIHVDAASNNENCKPNHDREIIAQLSNQAAVNKLESTLEKVSTNEVLESKSIYTYKVPMNLDYQDVLASLKNNPEVLSVDPNEVRCVADVASEPYFDKQWYLQQIDLIDAFKLEEGSANVTVAILDTGVNANHPELNGRILPGYDFVNDDPKPIDDNGHGTFIAGIIGSNINGVGIAGLTNNVKILPVKVGDASGEMDLSDIISGLYYAMEQDVDVINMSYTGEMANTLEKQALEEAYQQGITLVGASGNDGYNQPQYPASLLNVISVGASKNVNSTTYDPKLFRAVFSNYGSMIDVGAPGVNIISTDLGSGFITDDGTSFSAPMVSGLAALIKSKHPTWDPTMIEWAIEKGATNGTYSSGTWDHMLGYGVINYYESLKLAAPDNSDDITGDRSHANRIEMNDSISEKLHLPREEDWYQFSVLEDAMVTIELNRSMDNLNEVVDLYKKGQKASIDRIEDRPVGMKLEKGTYQLKVFETSGHWSESSYEFTVTPGGDGPSEGTHFTDVKRGTSHYDGVQWLAVQGIRGYKDGSFGVGKTLTRPHAAIMFTKALALAIPKSKEVRKYYLDVAADDAYADFIAAVGKAGVFKGSNGNFLPEKGLTREQMASTLVNAFHIKGNGSHVSINLENVSATHKASVQMLADLGITNQFSDFRPGETVTRGQFATFLYKSAADAS